MINMSLYTTNMSIKKQKLLDTILNIFIGIFMLEYLMIWIGYGIKAIKQKMFIFYSIGTIYLIILIVISYIIEIEPKLYRILYGIVVCLLSIRCFACKNFY